MAPDISGKQRAEPAPPVPHGFTAIIDAAFGQEVFNVPKRPKEEYLHHHHQADHFG
ncbi:hypothetical protein [Sphingosinicella rhizophila]|uniref:hypothetical protein n=1 Tax=Sphingosinicella rhizophila TaxID=3050082 RepID=UPI0028F092FE|nr:hypothetical protein [Sphingosinicella sp. GR2756]